jgi:phage baseplate assembly protein W
MAKYKDIDFFLKRNENTDDIQIKRDFESISQSIKNIILTDPGEKIFSPYFGGGIPNTLFNNYDFREVLILQETLKAKLALYEPRIEVNSININYTEQNTLLIELKYALQSQPSLVNTFTVEI